MISKRHISTLCLRWTTLNISIFNLSLTTLTVVLYVDDHVTGGRGETFIYYTQRKTFKLEKQFPHVCPLNIQNEKETKVFLNKSVFWSHMAVKGHKRLCLGSDQDLGKWRWSWLKETNMNKRRPLLLQSDILFMTSDFWNLQLTST